MQKEISIRKGMKGNIIGREIEIELLSRIYSSGQAEFVAVYGRRRVGKTFLIREYFEGNLIFQTSGLANANTGEQLQNFYYTIKRYDQTVSREPADWLEAFEMLISYLTSLGEGRKVLFFDELPWMDTQGANFVSALEHFWNGWASARRDIVLIVCGSATSWMMNKLINNHEGLYGRLTRRISLSPFTLGEASQFLASRGIMFSPYEIAETYMIMGGIPYYLQMLDARLSLAQNVDRLLFNPNGELYDEFAILYRSLFNDSDLYVKVVDCLHRKGYGMTRNEISAASGIKSGKTMTTILENLVACGFVRKYVNYGCTERKSLFQLIDFFTLFHFRFMRESSFRNLSFWTGLQRTPRFYTWAGISFEILVTTHVSQIKQKLGIAGVATSEYAWRSRKDQDSDGTQIDLIIERADNTLNICEMKFSEGECAITKEYEKSLRQKVSTFIAQTKTRKSVQLTLISTYGMKRTIYSVCIQNEVTLDDLFD